MTDQTRPGATPASTLLRTASSLAFVIALLPSIAQAQSEDQANVGTEEGEEDTIVVTGFRQSLQDALEQKRQSGNIVDGINAEDIGKSSDQNVAEALQRVTGISIERNNGEGSTVTVRGIDANLNNVTLNGITLTNAAGNVSGENSGQAVDFSALSADLLSRIEVAKTASADDNEGSLGATIRLRGFRPLDVRNDRRSISLQARYSEFGDRDSFRVRDDLLGGDYSANLALSQKLFDDTIGLSLVAVSEQTSSRRDTATSGQWEPFAAVQDRFVDPDNPDNILPGGITNIQTGELEFNGPTQDDRIRFLIPDNVIYDQTYFETRRNNVTGTIQIDPGPNTDIKLDVTYSRTDRAEEGTRLQVRPSPPIITDGTINSYDPVTSSIVSFRRQTVPFGPDEAGDPGFVRTNSDISDFSEETVVFGAEIEQEVGEFTFNLRGGISDSKARDDFFLDAQAQLTNFNTPRVQNLTGQGARPGFSSGFDCAPNLPCTIFLSDNVPYRTEGGTNQANEELAIVDDPSEFIVGRVAARDRLIDDRSEILFFDVDWDKEIGPFVSFEVGAKYSRRNRAQQQTNSGIGRSAFEPREIQIIGLEQQGGGLGNDFGERLGLPRDSITDGVVVLDPQIALEFLEQQVSGLTITRPELRDFRDVELTAYGGYAMANFDTWDGRLFGDIGVRWVKTEVASEGGSLVQATTVNFNNRFNQAFFEDAGFTEEEADAAILALFGPDLLGPNDDGFVTPEGALSAETNSYDNWLPSLNVNFVATEDILVRFAASMTMARPNIDSLRPNLIVNEGANLNANGRAGNPFLKPFRSTNLDLSVEWYFAEDSLFSVALFNKQLKDAERRITQVVYVRDPRLNFYDENGAFINDPAITGPFSIADTILPFTPNDQPLDSCLPVRYRDLNLQTFTGPDDPTLVRQCAPVVFTRPVNSSDAYVRGVEVSFQHNFTYLPGLLSGFGVLANYTYADSEVEDQAIDDGFGGAQFFPAAPLPNTSKHTFNTTLFYEKGPLQLRGAYNWRSDYLRTPSALNGGTRVYTEGFGSLDLSGSIDLTRQVSLNFQAVNVTDTVRRDYAVFEVDPGNPPGVAIPTEDLTLGNQPTGRTTLLQNTGRIFRIGVRARF